MNYKNYSLFIDSKSEFVKKYFDFIDQRLNRSNSSLTQDKTAIHHIVPVSWFSNNNIQPDNSHDNLIELTYYEHLVAHIMLFHIFKDDQDNKMYMKSIAAIHYILSQKLSINSYIVSDKHILNEYNDIIMDFINKKYSDTRTIYNYITGKKRIINYNDKTPNGYVDNYSDTFFIKDVEVEYNGQRTSLRMISKQFNIKYDLLKMQYMNGISIENILEDNLFKITTKINHKDKKLIHELYEFYKEYGPQALMKKYQFTQRQFEQLIITFKNTIPNFKRIRVTDVKINGIWHSLKEWLKIVGVTEKSYEQYKHRTGKDKLSILLMYIEKKNISLM